MDKIQITAKAVLPDSHWSVLSMARNSQLYQTVFRVPLTIRGMTLIAGDWTHVSGIRIWIRVVPLGIQMSRGNVLAAIDIKQAQEYRYVLSEEYLKGCFFKHDVNAC